MDKTSQTESLRQTNANVMMADRKTARKYMFNLLVMTFSFFFVYVAFSAVQNLETQLNQKLGSYSLATLYLVFTISCLFSPVVIDWLGTKWSLVLAMVFQCLFIASNLKPEWGTLIPASALLGFGASFLWSAQGTYLTQNAILYAQCNHLPAKSTLGLFSGIFFAIFQSTQIVGNLIAGFVFRTKKHVEGFGDVDPHTKTLLFIVFSASAVAGTILMCFLPKVKTDDQMDKKPLMDTIRATVQLMITPKMALLIPYMYFAGLEQAFIFGDFTKNQINDPSKTGFVMAVFGVTDAVGSFGLGRLSDYIGRIPIVVLGSTIQLAVCIVLLAWTSGHEHDVFLYVAAGAWGIGDAVANTMCAAILGSVFTENTEAAFSNLKLFQSLSVALAFFYGPYVGFETKLIIVMSSLVVGTTLVLILSVLYRHHGINRVGIN